MHNVGTGVEVVSYNGWDDAYTQYYYKYVNAGHTLPQLFCDAEISDWQNWGISSYYSQTAVVGTNQKIYWLEAYSFNETEIKAALNRTINGDTTAPVTSNLYPANGATGINPAANIQCNISDAGSGVNNTTVTMTVSAGGNNVPGILTLSGNFLNYTALFNPTSNFPELTVVTVTVNAKDLFGNTMTPPTWSFTTWSSANVAPTSFGNIKALYH